MAAGGGEDRNFFLRILEAPGEVQEYFLFRVDGREMLSAPFEFRLTMRTHVEVPPPSGWIGASITFTMGGSDTVPRKINGQCVRFEHAYQKGGYIEFVIDVAPSLMMTRLRRDYRIFTNVTAKQVINTILTEHGIVFDDTKVKYVTEVREYCVQYEESDFDFINRLMEDEGIFYFFKYDEDAGRYKHKTYLADDPSGYYDGDVFSLSFRRDHLLRGLQSIETSNSATTAKWVTHDYNYKKPRSLIPVATPSRLDWAVKNSFVYHWPGGHDVMEYGKRKSKLAIEETEAAAITLEGAGSYICFTPGARFEIDDQTLKPRERRIAIRSVIHSAWDPYSLEEGEPSYQQQFTAVPSYEPYRPPSITPPAVVRGPQTAVVLDQTDPEGFGRVKVRFHWDRHMSSTCWLRVAQQWGGDRIGAQFIPRPGMEVLVDFLEGDPDRPLVVGCLYNGDNKHPYEVPPNLSQSGWRSQTHINGEVYQEFIFEDKPGAEEIYTYAGRNYRRRVINDEDVAIQGFRDTRVGKNDGLAVGGTRTTYIGKDSYNEIVGRFDAKVHLDAYVKVGKGLVIEIGEFPPPPPRDFKVPLSGNKGFTLLPQDFKGGIPSWNPQFEPPPSNKLEQSTSGAAGAAAAAAMAGDTKGTQAGAAGAAGPAAGPSRAEAVAKAGAEFAGNLAAGVGGGPVGAVVNTFGQVAQALGKMVGEELKNSQQGAPESEGDVKGAQQGAPAGAATQAGPAGAAGPAGGGGSLLGGGGGAGELVKTIGKMIGEATTAASGVAGALPGGAAVGGAVGGALGGAVGALGAGGVGDMIGGLMSGFGPPKLTKLEFNDGLKVYSTSPLAFESTERITLTVGANTIELNPSGVIINGVLVRINS